MNTLDKLKSLSGSSPYVSDITKFIVDEFTGNELANQKMTNNTALLNAMQRDSNVKMRDAISGVIVQDDSGVLARQGVLSQTVSELIGLSNKIDIAKLNVEQDANVARLTQSNQYRVAELKGNLNVEMAGIEGEIDLEVAGVMAESKAEVAIRIGDADHDGKVEIEKQVSKNNIKLAEIKRDNSIRIGSIRGENIVKLATIDAATIDKESAIDVEGVKSASDIQVLGIKKERKYDADFIITQANNENALKEVSTIAEKTNIDLMASSDVSLTNIMAQSKKGVIEVSTKTEISSIKALADNESKTNITMANAKVKSIEALSSGKIASIRADANIDAGFTKTSANIEADAINKLALSKKNNYLSEAVNEVNYLSKKGESHRTAISSDFMLSDSLSKNLSELEVDNTKSLSDSEVSNIKQASIDKIDAMNKENSAQIGFIKDVAIAKSDSIKGVADTRYGFVKSNADIDYKNKEDSFKDVEMPNARAVSKIILDGDKAYSTSRNAKQSIIDSVETSEISKIGNYDADFMGRMAGIDTAAISKASGIDVDAINTSANQRYSFILSQSQTRRTNESTVSNDITIPQIKALSRLKIKEYQDRNNAEELKYAQLTPQMVNTITQEGTARAKQITDEALIRYNGATGLADKKVAAETEDSQARIDLTNTFNGYLNRLKINTKNDLNSLSKETAFYMANTVQKNTNYKNNSPTKSSYSGGSIQSVGIEAPPDFK